jgi:hypothetical protein
MIAMPIVQVRCDGRDAERPDSQCRSSGVVTLPCWEMQRDQVAALFVALNPGWVLPPDGRVTCPRCMNLRRARQLAEVTQ